jgi:Family of unknown function (DUF6069)
MASFVPLVTQTPAASRRIALGRLPAATLLSVSLAAVLNVALFFFFSSVGVITSSVLIQTLVGPQPLDAAMVASMTVIQMLVGVVALAAIAYFRPTNAERIWQIVAGVVLVLSFSLPFGGIADVPLGYALSLDAMHLVAGALAIWMLPALARTR